LGAVLFKATLTPAIIHIGHVQMKRMHFSNAKLNTRFWIVAWNSACPPDTRTAPATEGSNGSAAKPALTIDG
jgi:hypothetical protein